MLKSIHFLEQIFPYSSWNVSISISITHKILSNFHYKIAFMENKPIIR